MNLIEAAVSSRVRRFSPAEYEGRPSVRPPGDVLGRNRQQAECLEQLQLHASVLEYTVFVCGIFYERFAPGGLQAYQLGGQTHYAGQGDFLMDVGANTAEIVETTNSGHPVRLSMTSLNDAANFIVRALDLPDWPSELRMRGARMTPAEIVATAENHTRKSSPPLPNTFPFMLLSLAISFCTNGLCGTEMLFGTIRYEPGQLPAIADYATATENYHYWWRIQCLIACAQGRYDFDRPNLNEIIPDFVPETFRAWLQRVWPR
jgi:hypothetical protein